MTATKQRVVTNLTKAVLSRNRKLLTVLEHMETVRAVDSLTVVSLIAVPTSVTTARALLRELRHHQLIEHSHVAGDTVRNSGQIFWKITEGAVTRARVLFPTVAPEQDERRYGASREDAWRRKRTGTEIRRDPLDLLLMGTGRAPSLNFRDSVEKG